MTDHKLSTAFLVICIRQILCNSDHGYMSVLQIIENCRKKKQSGSRKTGVNIENGCVSITMQMVQKYFAVIELPVGLM